MNFRRVSLTFLIIMVAFAAACTQRQPEPGAAPSGEVPAEATPVPTDEEAEQVAAEALPAARLALAEYLGTTPDEIELEKIEDAQWPNACLGLPEPDEMCAEVLTEGYLITFTYEDESYAVRTDLSGDAVRLEAATGPFLQPAPVAAAREALAKELRLAPEVLEVLSFEEEEWSDSCLGLGGPAESCLAAITPGWRVMLAAEGQTYEVRTDESGQTVRIAGEQAGQPAGEAPGPELNGAALFYQRSGGITGEILTVRIYGDGTVERIVGRPEPDTPVEMATVDPAAVETLLEELKAAGYFELGRSYLPEDTCCDRFLYLISAEQNGETHTVEALEATPEMPTAVGESIGLIEAFISNSFAE